MEIQSKLWARVERELLATGEIEPQGDDESGELYGQRVNEAVDHYVNTHNFANELVM